VNTPTLAMPLDGGGYVLHTDANNFSMGCILHQWHNEELKVIGYASKTFSEAELRYCTTHRELSAIMFGVRYYRHFLLGFPFVLRTGHAAVLHLMRTLHPLAQSARYLDTLAEYQFTVQYRPGESHKNADVLSRRPCNRNLNSLMCKQRGPLLQPIEEISELEGESEDKTSVRDELGIACTFADKLSRVVGRTGTAERSLRLEAPIFVPQVKYDEIVEETGGCEAETISVEMDRLMGTADEVGLCVGPLTPEKTSYELLARSTKATPQKGQS